MNRISRTLGLHGIRALDRKSAGDGIEAHANHRRLCAALQQQWRGYRHALQCQRGGPRRHHSSRLRRNLEEASRRE